jgi:transposase
MITEHQYRRLMTTYQQSGVVSHAAMKAGMHRETAARYLEAQAGPEQLRRPHTWRTRGDPLEALWLKAKPWLEATPELEAKALFEHLLAEDASLASGQALRTFQRRVRRWRAQHGPPREVHFPQIREPGQSLQLDWTHCDELGVTIGGAAFGHLLCHSVLPYSNWEWAVPCHSESLLSLRIGLQAALWALGGVPVQLQTDQSSTATHVLDRTSKQRGFNQGYLALCAHYALEPRTIHVACPNENGDIESANGHLKRRLKNHLALRGSHDFTSETAYAAFVSQVCTGANLLRQNRLIEERSHLRPLPEARFAEAEEMTVRVSSYSTVRVKGCAYSVPSNYLGQFVQARLTETELSLHYAQVEIARYPRLPGREARIDYRHIIASLVRKPGAFQHCLYRDQLFPALAFRQAYDRLQQVDPTHADAHYVQLLALAADVGETPVSETLSTLLREGEPPMAEQVRARLQAPLEPATLGAFTPELTSYDQLNRAQEVSA